ncbi:MAG: tetratricopeptide repeat protein, partial [Gammaproteobacteria bacterium]
GQPSRPLATEPFVAKLGEAQALLQAGKVDKAADAFQTILSRDANLEAHIRLIRDYQRRREWSEGLQEAGIALAAFPDSAVLAALKRQLLLTLNRIDEAEQANCDISNAGLIQKYTSGSTDENIVEFGPNNTADLEQWMAYVVANLTPQELREGVSALDKASDAAQQQYRDEDVIRLRTRAVEYLNALHAVEMNSPVWIDQVYAKHLRQSALAYDRLASARNEEDDVEAARYWAQGSQCLEQLLARVPEQPEWVTGLYQKMARQGARACDRLASA